MAVPKARRVPFRREALGDALEKAFEERAWPARTGVDLGGGREVFARPMRQVGAGGVAVQHLCEKGMDGGDGTEDAFTINVTEIVARLLDDARRERLADIGLELRDDLSDRSSHPWPPGKGKVL